MVDRGQITDFEPLKKEAEKRRLNQKSSDLNFRGPMLSAVEINDQHQGVNRNEKHLVSFPAKICPWEDKRWAQTLALISAHPPSLAKKGKIRSPPNVGRCDVSRR